jgi:hypothetical protein
MEWEGPIKATYIDLPRGLVLQVKAEAALRNTTIKGATQEALEVWLKPDGGTSAKEPDPDIEMLCEVKRIAQPGDYAVLKQTLVVFLRDARRELVARQQKKA